MNNPQKKYWIYVIYPTLKETRKISTPFKSLTEAQNFAAAYITARGYQYEIKGEKNA